MTDTCYLIIDRKGVQGFRKTKPDLKGGQHAVYVKVNVDDRYFKASTPTALIEIGEEFLMTPEIDVEVQPLEDV